MESNKQPTDSTGAIRKPKASINEILRDVLALCHVEGSLNAEGVVPLDTVYRRFTGEVFRQYRQDVRQREFQVLMSRSEFLLETIADRKEYRIDLEKLLAEGRSLIKDPKSIVAASGIGSVDERKNLNGAINHVAKDPVKSISRIKKLQMVRDEPDLDRSNTGVDFRYVTTVSRPLDPTFSVQDYSCLICREHFLSSMTFLHHIGTHGPSLVIQETPSLRRTKSPLEVSFRYDNCQLTSTLVVKNRDEARLIIDGVYLYHKLLHLYPISLQPVFLDHNRNQGFLIQNQVLRKSPEKYSILITFRRSQEHWDLLEQYHLQVYERGNSALLKTHRSLDSTYFNWNRLITDT